MLSLNNGNDVEEAAKGKEDKYNPGKIFKKKSDGGWGEKFVRGFGNEKKEKQKKQKNKKTKKQRNKSKDHTRRFDLILQ